MYTHMRHIFLWALALIVTLPATRLHAQEQTCPPHQFVDGFCTVCKQLDEEYLYPDQQGYYQIATPQALRWFAEYVALDAEHASLCARITADLDMANVAFPGLGSNTTPYEGEFDGGGHTITNLVINKSSESGVGFINVGNANTWLHDLTLGSGCSITGSRYVAGFIGKVDNKKGKEIHVQRLGFEGIVNVNNNGGAIIGCVPDNSVHAYLQSCYSTGTIYGKYDNGALCGWASYAHVKNCYVRVKGNGFESGSDVVRGWTPMKFHNTYASGAAQKSDGLGTFTTTEMQNGTLLNKLADPAYKQEEGDDNPKLKK